MRDARESGGLGDGYKGQVVAVCSLFSVGAQWSAKGPKAASSSPSRADPISLSPSGVCGAMSVMLSGGGCLRASLWLPFLD